MSVEYTVYEKLLSDIGVKSQSLTWLVCRNDKRNLIKIYFGLMS